MRKNIGVLKINHYLKEGTDKREHLNNERNPFPKNEVNSVDSKISIGRLIMRLGMCMKRGMNLETRNIH